MDDLGRPFESIESAQEFMELLAECVADAKQEIAAELEGAEAEGQARRGEALRLVVHKLNQVGVHVLKSQRALNDLRTLRRLLYDERGQGRSEEAMVALAHVNGNGGRGSRHS